MEVSRTTFKTKLLIDSLKKATTIGPSKILSLSFLKILDCNNGKKMLVVFRKDFLKCVSTCISSKKACAFGFRVITSVSDHHARIFYW